MDRLAADGSQCFCTVPQVCSRLLEIVVELEKAGEPVLRSPTAPTVSKQQGSRSSPLVSARGRHRCAAQTTSRSSCKRCCCTLHRVWAGFPCGNAIVELFVPPASERQPERDMLSRLLRASAQVTTLLLDKMRRLKNRLNRVKTRVERVRPGWLHCHGLKWAGMLLAREVGLFTSPCFGTPSRQVL